MKRATRPFTHEIDNPSLKKALELRQQGNPEARNWLEKACAEGDAKALYYKALAVADGGFFIKRGNASDVLCLLRESMKLGCVWAMFDFGDKVNNQFLIQKAFESGDNFVFAKCYSSGCKDDIGINVTLGYQYLKKAEKEGNHLVYADIHNYNSKNIMKWLEKGAFLGDASAQFMLSAWFDNSNPEKSCYWLSIAAKQRHFKSMVKLAKCYRFGIGCAINETLSAKYTIKCNVHYLICDHIIREPDNGALFVYGQAFCNNAMSYQNLAGPMKDKAIDIYKRATCAARAAALCFTWAFKGNPYLNKDVIRMIAQMVYQSRESPRIWGVFIK